MTVANWSGTAALNVLDSGTAGSGGAITLDGSVMTPSQVDDAFRSVMAQIATWRTAATFTGGITLTQTAFATALSIVSTDAGANGIFNDYYHNSASPAVSDIIGSQNYSGNSSTGVKRTYGQWYWQITDPTNASEDSSFFLFNYVAGVQTQQFSVTATGVQIPALGATTPGTGAHTTFTTTGVTTLKGSITNDSAAAGNIGEVISASVASGSAVTLTTATAKTVTSIALTAGDWDVYGQIGFFPGATTSITKVSESLSLTTDTSDATEGVFSADTFPAIVYGAVAGAKVLSPLAARFSLAAPATVYLVALSTFTVAGNTAYGKIWARRAR